MSDELLDSVKEAKMSERLFNCILSAMNNALGYFDNPTCKKDESAGNKLSLAIDLFYSWYNTHKESK